MIENTQYLVSSLKNNLLHNKARLLKNFHKTPETFAELKEGFMLKLKLLSPTYFSSSLYCNTKNSSSVKLKTQKKYPRTRDTNQTKHPRSSIYKTSAT